MERTTPIVLLASDHPEKGVYHLEGLSPRALGATTAGDGPALNPKRTPNEDSLALYPLSDGYAALVADAHFGPSSGEIAARTFVSSVRRSPPASARALGRLGIAIDAAVLSERPKGDTSEAAVLLATLRGTQLEWAGIGDCRLLRYSPGAGVTALNEGVNAFVGGRIFGLFRERLLSLEPPLGETGQVTLSPGDVVLLASDGLDEEVSGLSLERLGAILARPLPLEARLAEVMTEGGRASKGGGRDNLSVVALEV